MKLVLNVHVVDTYQLIVKLRININDTNENVQSCIRLFAYESIIYRNINSNIHLFLQSRLDYLVAY